MTDQTKDPQPGDFVEWTIGWPLMKTTCETPPKSAGMTPRFKKVSESDFKAFIDSYPRKLVANVYGAGDPPLVTYNDFALAPLWPESVVAMHFASFLNEPESGWKILDTDASPATD